MLCMMFLEGLQAIQLEDGIIVYIIYFFVEFFFGDVQIINLDSSIFSLDQLVIQVRYLLYFGKRYLEMKKIFFVFFISD